MQPNHADPLHHLVIIACQSGIVPTWEWTIFAKRSS